MSLVGPRPEVPTYVVHWAPAERNVILSVRPGITDPATLSHRNEADELAAVPHPETYYLDVLLPHKIALYVDYVRTRTMVGDIRTLAKTVLSVLAG
jgi:lipopolysaccharide/colanic/teichoic acid biosynthesis glycosyltransferase